MCYRRRSIQKFKRTPCSGAPSQNGKLYRFDGKMQTIMTKIRLQLSNLIQALFSTTLSHTTTDSSHHRFIANIGQLAVTFVNCETYAWNDKTSKWSQMIHFPVNCGRLSEPLCQFRSRIKKVENYAISIVLLLPLNWTGSFFSFLVIAVEVDVTMGASARTAETSASRKAPPPTSPWGPMSSPKNTKFNIVAHHGRLAKMS